MLARFLDDLGLRLRLRLCWLRLRLWFWLRFLLDGLSLLRRRALQPPSRHVTQHAVGDAQDAGDLVQRLGRAREEKQVVEALRLVVDLVRQLPPAPDVVAVPAAAAALDGLADAR